MLTDPAWLRGRDATSVASGRDRLDAIRAVADRRTGTRSSAILVAGCKSVSRSSHVKGLSRRACAYLSEVVSQIQLGSWRSDSLLRNRALIDFARHYGFQPKACRPYRAKTKGKVERPFRYIREDFFLARSFRNLDDLNAQLRHWIDTVANPRVHATTQRVVNEAFAEEKPHLKTLPLAPFRSVLKLERRVSHEGMVSVAGNLYSVPDATRKRIVEVHTLANEVQIFEDGALIATHPVLEGRKQRRVSPIQGPSCV